MKRAWIWLGDHCLPSTAFTMAGRPVMLSMWRTCAYSWVTSVVSQSSCWLRGERSSGAVRKSRRVLKGIAVALPLASSVTSLSTTSVRPRGDQPSGPESRACTPSAMSATRRATGSMS